MNSEYTRCGRQRTKMKKGKVVREISPFQGQVLVFALFSKSFIATSKKIYYQFKIAV